MRIINETHYRTSDLRMLAVRIAREELTQEKAKLVKVTFGYRRSRPDNFSTSGFARLGGTKCRINLSRHGVDQIDLALTLAHEFAHLRGLVHRQMQNVQYRRMGKWREWYAWAAAYPIRGREAPSPEKVLAQKLRYAETMWRRSQRKFRLAAAPIKRWARRVRYYAARLEKMRTLTLGGTRTPHANDVSLGKTTGLTSQLAHGSDRKKKGAPREWRR